MNVLIDRVAEAIYNAHRYAVDSNGWWPSWAELGFGVDRTLYLGMAEAAVDAWETGT